MTSTMTTTQAGQISNLTSAQDTFKVYVEEMLYNDKRFKGMAAYVSKVVFYWDNRIETACAGHGFIFFNPQWWDQMVHEERKTVVAHEIWHLICKHLVRGEGKDPSTYNKAGDYFINLACHEDGFLTTLNNANVPNTNFGDMGMLIDMKYHNMGTDEIYYLLRQQQRENPQPPDPDEMPQASKEQIEDLIKELLEMAETSQTLQEVAEEHEEAVDTAIEKGKSIGDQPAGTDIVLTAAAQKVFIQKKSYEEIFEDYLTDPLSSGRRTYMRPSRRQSRGSSLKLKGRMPKTSRTNRLTHLVYALDVSGSISREEGNMFLSSAKTLKEKLNPEKMTIILWDTEIVFEREYLEQDTLNNIRIQAGGGTCLKPVYERVEQIKPEALVIFTDLCVEIPPQPEWETIWFVSSENIHDYYLNKVEYGDVYLVPKEV